MIKDKRVALLGEDFDLIKQVWASILTKTSLATDEDGRVIYGDTGQVVSKTELTVESEHHEEPGSIRYIYHADKMYSVVTCEVTGHPRADGIFEKLLKFRCAPTKQPKNTTLDTMCKT